MDETHKTNVPDIKNKYRTVTNRKAFDYALGSVLGDGSIDKDRGRLVIDQSVKNYTIWKCSEAVNCELMTPKDFSLTLKPLTRTRIDKITKHETKTVSYRDYTLGLFKSWRPIFYTKKEIGDPTYGRGNSVYRKKIPKQIINWFTSPYSLAIWYMDDGCFMDNSALIRTGEIPESEVKLLQHTLKTNFGLETTIRRDRDVAASIYIRRESWEKFKQLVEPTVLQVPEMIYKLGKPL